VSIKEQKAIAQVLTDMDAEIEALEKKKNKYEMLKKGAMELLLTGKVRLN
jgi:type I restriction enzyme S subunit